MTPYEDYNTFNPRKLDTDQWIRAAKAAGVKIAILTATHETGFALYQSDVNPYCMKALKFQGGQGDLVRDFVNSCRKYGIKPGIYIGIRWNSFYGIHDFKVNGNNAFAKNRQRHYNRLCEEMVRELCSRYGELAIVWFDGGAHGPAQGGPDILPIFETRTTNGWETLFEGSCIGHKFIHRFEEKTASASRLKISEYAAEPQIKAFTVYHSD